MDIVRQAGHTITYDWTEYDGSKDNFNEARRQYNGVGSADVLILVEHPRLKAGWMEFGVAVSLAIPTLVIPHPEVSPSMWYTFPNVNVIGNHTIPDAISLVA